MAFTPEGFMTACYRRNTGNKPFSLLLDMRWEIGRQILNVSEILWIVVNLRRKPCNTF